MATLKEVAEQHEIKTLAKNIADIEKVPILVDVREETFTDKEGKEFSINVATIEGEDYRVPNSVLAQVKGLLEEKPDMEFFKVKKKGESLNTTYQVFEA